MKTRKHGQGLTHKEVVGFSNRLANSAKPETEIKSTSFIRGWEAACKYYAHQLRKELRFREQLNEIIKG